MNNKIDWLNHTIAFLSALLGILIAFQLDDYQEDRREQEELQIALNSIKEEIEANLEIFTSNSEGLSEWLQYWELAQSTDGFEYVNKELFVNWQNQFPLRYQGWEIIEDYGDSVLVKIKPEDIVIDILPKTGISSSSWQAASYSGILNRLDHSTLSKLTRIYMWIEKDFGVDELQIYDLAIKNDDVDGPDDIDFILNTYKDMLGVQSWKLRMINEIYEEIEWE